VAGEPLPDWWHGDDAPLVYLTLGTVAPQFGFFPGLYRAAIDALATLPVRVLVTTGRGHDPADLGPLPARVHAERWVPQAAVMPHTAAMVCHGGFGTVRAGLAAGVPLAVLPLFADQPDNARRVVELGAGLAPADVSVSRPRSRRCWAIRRTPPGPPRSAPTSARCPWWTRPSRCCAASPHRSLPHAASAVLLSARDAAPADHQRAHAHALPPDRRLRLPVGLRDDGAAGA